MKKIGVLLIATNKYKQFVQPLVDGLDKHFFVNHQVEVHLFTDDPGGSFIKSSDRIEIITHSIPSYKFPYATLYRYKIFNDHRESFGNCSHLFYSDVDMAFVDFVGEEILPDGITDEGLVAVLHPGFYKGGGSWETRPESKAYIPPELRIKYYCGGVNGGTTESFLKMAKELSENIADDERRGIVPIWHDESSINCYLSTRTPKTLLPSFCMVEEESLQRRWGIADLPKKIIALKKDHAAIRS